jgi:hypothetical protein
MKIAFYFLPALFLVGCGNQEPVVSSGKIDRIADFPSENVAPRNVDVWLPEGYDSSTKYAVIYMHDGQMLFDSTTTWNKQEWKVDEVVTKLIDDGRISPCIVVGIWNNGDYRHTEYFPRAALDGLYEPHQLLVDEIMASKGFNSENWMTKKYDGDDHSELSWSKRLAIPLTFLLATDQYRQ